MSVIFIRRRIKIAVARLLGTHSGSALLNGGSLQIEQQLVNRSIKNGEYSEEQRPGPAAKRSKTSSVCFLNFNQVN